MDFLKHRDRSDKSDDQLIQDAQKGSEEAITTLYRRYVEAIYRFCYWQTNFSEDAEDLTQYIFIQLVKSLHTFRFESSFKNWLYTIAKNVVSGWVREKYKLPTLPLIDTIHQPEQLVSEKNGEVKERIVADLLSRLKPQHQRVLTLRYLRGYSVEETAKELKLSISNVKVITKRSLEKLAKEI